MTHFFYFQKALLSIVLCIIGISIFSLEVQAQSLRIEARNPEIIEGETGYFDIYFTRETPSEEEEEEEEEEEDIEVIISLRFSGDFFMGTPVNQSVRDSIKPDQNYIEYSFPTERDNLIEPDGYVLVTVRVLTGPLLIRGVNYASTSIIVFDSGAGDESLVSSAHKDILPEVIKATNSSSFGAISNRFDQFPTSANDSTTSLNYDNQFTYHPPIDQITQGLKTHSWQQLINDLSFGFAATHNSSGPRSSYIWGKAEYQQISGSDKNSGFDWEGRVIGTHIGFDTRPSTNTIVGLLTSFSNHNLDFDTNNQNFSGQSTHRMLSLFPYFGWSTQNQLFNLWTSVGYGLGQITLDTKDRKRLCNVWKREESDDDAQCPHQLYTDTNLRAISLGSKLRLFSGTLLSEETSLSVKSGISGSLLDIESVSEVVDSIRYKIEGDEIQNFQARIAIENSYKFPISTEYKLNPIISIGGRWDGGHGSKGYGVDIDANLSLQAAWGAIQTFGKYLIIHNDDSINEWGVGGNIMFDSGLNRLGSIFNFSVNSGSSFTTPHQKYNIWDNQFITSDLAESQKNLNQHQLESEIGYGFALGEGDSIITPFVAANFSVNNPDHLQIGSKFSIASNANLEVKATHRLNSDQKTSQLYSVAGAIRW